MNTQLIHRKAKLHAKSTPRMYEWKEVPWLNLSGYWLEKAGFEIGDSITISVSHETLVINIAGKAAKPGSIRED
ncbi:type I toxin-antitoxin system SymE family toxin [Chitinophaga nivalis]|uniref:Type I toxin-antitoxin system SymE family toxin n=1 Tax=Chitinophaga nivalis TaxID=2991709 RepID=A0ABT3IMK2_9BACT|nr:type I toxin-antitoxin system SymE family toxin [Chitinophaga nivalis]MCW3465172.1 type I toxin-antitoxin system SymE family toxin [Chitinophaga nivalis]MCW3485136.1 type I toxin-antitoxin system SymE family toxin [Chitinophaga nivalis]